MEPTVYALKEAIGAVVTMLRADYRFNAQDEVVMASEMARHRDAFGRWRRRERTKSSK